MRDNPSTALDEARAWLRDARRVAVLTGAGVSAESGVPTFRDAQTGLWARFRPEDLATEQAFRRNPGRVWDWYAERREKLLGVQPNAGHHALAAFARRAPGRLTLITQNVDGLHQLAGSEGVLCLHGRLADDRWLDHPRPCCDLARAVPDRPPRCAGCGNLVRPGVVWFGEALPTQALDAAQQAVQACDVMLVVGTAGAVYPAAGLAHQARQAGARVVVLNVGPSELDGIAHAVLRGPSAQLLPALLDVSFHFSINRVREGEAQTVRPVRQAKPTK
ncbi:SIR2 family NAD-dependent protein deacylase [Alicycliphilus denitrificans]|uniref:SIR2 family NAD-dependent protein deacylase n=1 Tax=Alicycliphilus denitrificans TaxID=179636 RepID=UPI0001D9ED38|nr:NAD-dependent deacylase [Alicycliphilus denitrificans]ADV00265.1 Silent information regulator protein Sir2 [Alicycliphilus denitrificans BC]GAO23021.1 NAD-dependent protein deacetylase [Alicycliphilus sp. B1]